MREPTSGESSGGSSLSTKAFRRILQSGQRIPVPGMNAQKRRIRSGLPYPSTRSSPTDKSSSSSCLNRPPPSCTTACPRARVNRRRKPGAPAGRSTMQEPGQMGIRVFQQIVRTPSSETIWPAGGASPQTRAIFSSTPHSPPSRRSRAAHPPRRGSLCATCRSGAGQQPDRILRLKGIPGRPCEWFVHVRKQGGRFATRPVGAFDQATGKNLRLFRIRQEGSVAKLDVEHQSFEAGSEFLGKNGSGDQVDAFHRSRDVANRIESLVRRSNPFARPDNGASGRTHDPGKFLPGNHRPVTRNRIKLVERASGMPARVRKSWDASPANGQGGSENQRDLSPTPPVECLSRTGPGKSHC